MKKPFPIRPAPASFTLIEVLTAIAVFSIMIIFFGAILTSVTTVSSVGQQNAENSSNARAILDLMSRELRAGVSRPDLFVNRSSYSNLTNWIGVADDPTLGSTLMFYSANVGSTITPTGGSPAPAAADYRPLSYIEYTLAQTSTNYYLERGDQAVLWTDASAKSLPLGYPASAAPTAPTPALSDVLDGVVAFQVSFLQQDGTFSAAYSGTNTVAAVVSVALVDSNTFKSLLSSGNLQNLSSKLTQASAGSAGAQTSGGSPTSPKEDWENALNSNLLNGYPEQVRTGLRFFERSVDLPKPIL